MAKVYDSIDSRLEQWIGSQQLFFVATAPDGEGHVNVSPKGPIESLRVLDPHTIAYVDMAGSGIETVAHIRQNGRICVMLCAFQGPPLILRLHGRGEVLSPSVDEFSELMAGFDLSTAPALEGAARSVVRVSLDRIADSCGFDVPLMEHVGARPQRSAWLERKLAQAGDGAVAEYVAANNAESIDGLAGI